MKAFIAICLLCVSLSTSAEFYSNEALNLSSITSIQAFELFTFQSKFISDNRVTIVLPPVGSKSFKSLAFNIGKSPNSYMDTVQSKEHGGAAFPVWADSELEVLRKVSSINNSIGYYHDKIAINTGFGIRIINIR
jgi:hypothetical protein